MSSNRAKNFNMQAVLLFLAVFFGTSYSSSDWWENGNFYQVYPRSFKDSDADGIGDLKGVTEKLQYLKDIGMTAIWLSPIFQSPMVDFGYDISDYYSIQEEYGSNENFDALIAKAQEVGLKIILDFVPNHTSDQHEWFQKSVAGDPKYRDFYVWRNGSIDEQTGERKPPNNWLGAFRYSAWEWNDQRQQYYLHQFSVQQPDLNFRNPDVIEAMNDIMRYWLGKGVSGFRIDAILYLYEYMDEDGNFPDEPLANDPDCPDPDDICYLEHIYTFGQNQSFELVYQWREVVDNWKKDHGGETKVILTEAYTSIENLMKMYGDGVRNGSNVPFNFDLLSSTNGNTSAKFFKDEILKWINGMPNGAYANWVLGNHDTSRLATRFGPERTDLMNILLQTLPGIAVTYNGEEIGMTDANISWEDTVDPQGCDTSPETYKKYSRDPERTPFQWDDTSNAGFSTADKTWLPVNTDYKTKNVEKQLSENGSRSYLKIFQKLVQLRKEPAFDVGSFEIEAPNNTLIYKREEHGSDTYVIVLNFENKDKVLNLSDYFDGIDADFEIITASVQSEFIDGQIVGPNEFNIQGSVGAILKKVQ